MESRDKRVALVTAMDFWRLGGGAFVRDIALMWHLGHEAELTVIYVGSTRGPTNGALTSLGLPIAFVSLTDGPETTGAQKADRLRTHFARHPVDVCLFDRVEPAYLIDAVPEGTRTFLDTHDVPGDPIEGLISEEDKARDHEYWLRALAIYRRFDRVIAIQARDFRRLGEALGPEKVLLAPHPASLPRVERPATARRIGLVASDWIYNIEGLAWLVEEVWPQLDDLDLELHLYGRSARFVDTSRLKNVIRHGFVLDLAGVYRQIDVAINPTRRGSGLKIKTVEAMSSGLPLVTTSEGARGLEDLAGTCFLVADQPHQFADAIRRVVTDRALRDRLANTAAQHATRNMSPEACLGPLIDEVLA